MVTEGEPDYGADGANARVVAGRYRLEELLGRGGMGVVWRATDQLLGRGVAVKELPFDDTLTAADARRQRERTLREARALAQLSHPNIIVVHDVVEDDERPYIVLELIDGPSLAERMAADGPVDAAEAARIGVDLLGRCAPHTRPGCCTGTSSPPTCCWRTAPTGCCSPTSASPRCPARPRSPRAVRSSAPRVHRPGADVRGADRARVGPVVAGRAAVRGAQRRVAVPPGLVERRAARGGGRRDQAARAGRADPARGARPAGARPGPGGWTPTGPNGCCAPSSRPAVRPRRPRSRCSRTASRRAAGTRCGGRCPRPPRRTRRPAVPYAGSPRGARWWRRW